MRIKIFLILFGCLLVPSLALAESITLTTYYPSPYGSYDRLKLGPRTNLADADCDDSSEEGVFYYSSTDDELKICIDLDQDGTPGWEKFQGIWSKNNDNIFLDEVDFPNLKVGIGDASPDAALEISASGGTDDLLKLSGNDGDDGDILTVMNDGSVGVGEPDPASVGGLPAKMVIKGATSADTNASLVVTNAANASSIVVRDDGVVGIGKEPTEDSFYLDVKDSLAVVSDTQAKIMFKRPGGLEYSIGIDSSSGTELLHINVGSNLTDTTPELTLDSSGNLYIRGKIYQIEDGGGTDQEVKVKYVPGANPGFYATYAP